MAISKEWWDRWWKEDWSWTGLAAKPWFGWFVLPNDELRFDIDSWRLDDPDAIAAVGAGARRATLQDYWRDEHSRLIPSPDGKLQFTRLHLPLAWPDGEPTEKAGWPTDALDELLRKELQQAADRAGALEQGNSYLASPKWSGAVFLDFDLGNIAPPAGDDDDRIAFAAKCDSAAFSGDAVFENAAFSGEAHFENAAFSGNALFQNAAFSGEAWFLNAAFSGEARFVNAAFSGGAWFLIAAFSRDAQFGDAAFSGDAWFHNAAFSGDAVFQNAAFSGGAWFKSAAFSGEALFQNAAFSGEALFQNAAFVRDAEFGSAVFAGVADFRGAGRCLDHGGGDRRPDVNGAARGSVGRFRAKSAVFLGDADFSNRDIADGPDGQESDFAGARFFGLARFHDADLHPGINFASARFEDALEKGRIERQACEENGAGPYPEDALRNLARTTLGERPDDRWNDDEDKGPILEKQGKWDADYRIWRREFLQRRCQEATRFHESEAARSSYFRALEDCFRTLKQFNEERRDRLEEARFFRLELLARSQRFIERRPWGDRFFTFCYRRFSDFGTSIFRPFVIALVSIPLFAFVYALMGAWFNHALNGDEYMDALIYSAARLFPFGPWAEPDACSAIGQMMGLPQEGDDPCPAPMKYGYWTPFALGFVATFQSLLAVALFFLSGLALRRRFQID